MTIEFDSSGGTNSQGQQHMYDLIITFKSHRDRPYTDINIQAPKLGAPAIELRTTYNIAGLCSLCRPISRLLDKVAFSSLSQNQKGSRDLRKIREAGYGVLKRLLNPHKGAHQLIKRVWASASSASPIRIRIVGRDGAGMPWELMMIDDPETCYNRLDKPHLIGDRAIVSRHLEENRSHFPYDAEEIKIVALSHQNLKHSAREIYELQQRTGRGLHHVSEVNTGNVLIGAKQICNEMVDFEPYQIAHFACHNTIDADPGRIFVMEVRKSFPLSMNELNYADFRLASNCLVFLNCCCSGYVIGKHSSLVDYLLMMGGSAALATLCRIDDNYAQDMSRFIYDGILPPPGGRGSSIGEAVLRARNELWEQSRSLSGYAYPLYGEPDLKLAYNGVKEAKGGGARG